MSYSSLSPPQKAIDEYLDSMDEREKIAFEIAKDHLQSSFDIVRSIGFQDFFKSWMKKQQKNETSNSS